MWKSITTFYKTIKTNSDFSSFLNGSELGVFWVRLKTFWMILIDKWRNKWIKYPINVREISENRFGGVFIYLLWHLTLYGVHQMIWKSFFLNLGRKLANDTFIHEAVMATSLELLWNFKKKKETKNIENYYRYNKGSENCGLMPNWIVWNRTVYCIKMNLAINILHWLMCHKTKCCVN